jgi:multidrug transporter EmrE-like cation transporter
MNIVTLFFILTSVLLSVSAQILLKHGMTSKPVQMALTSNPIDAIIEISTNMSIIGGISAYASSMVVWLFVLSKVDVSTAYPFVGIGFIGTMLFAHYFLGESITTFKMIGTVLIFLGVVFISR